MLLSAVPSMQMLLSMVQMVQLLLSAVHSMLQQILPQQKLLPAVFNISVRFLGVSTNQLMRLLPMVQMQMLLAAVLLKLLASPLCVSEHGCTRRVFCGNAPSSCSSFSFHGGPDVAPSSALVDVAPSEVARGSALNVAHTRQRVSTPFGGQYEPADADVAQVALDGPDVASAVVALSSAPSVAHSSGGPNSSASVALGVALNGAPADVAPSSALNVAFEVALNGGLEFVSTPPRGQYEHIALSQ